MKAKEHVFKTKEATFFSKKNNAFGRVLPKWGINMKQSYRTDIIQNHTKNSLLTTGITMVAACEWSSMMHRIDRNNKKAKELPNTHRQVVVQRIQTSPDN